MQRTSLDGLDLWSGFRAFLRSIPRIVARTRPHLLVEQLESRDVPAGATVPSVEVTTATRPASTTQLTTTFQDVPGLTATAPTAGVYRLSALLHVQNFTTSANLVQARLTINGTSRTHHLLTFGPNTNTFTESLSLDDFVTLNANDIVRVQVTSQASASVNNGSPSVLRLWEFNPIPAGGPGVEVTTATRPASTTQLTTTFQDVPGLTATAPTAGVYRLSALLHVQNFTTSANLVQARLTINGTSRTHHLLTFGPNTNTFTESLSLDDFVTLNANDIVRVQVTSQASASVNDGSPSVLRLWEFNPGSAGPSVEVLTVTRSPEATSLLTGFQDVPGLIAVAPSTGLYRLSALVHFQNFTASANLIQTRFTIDGTPQITQLVTFEPGTNTFTESASLDHFAMLNAGDIVRVQATSQASASVNDGSSNLLRLWRHAVFPVPMPPPTSQGQSDSSTQTLAAPRPVRLRGLLKTRQVRKRRILVVQVFDEVAGAMRGEMISPFQSPAIKALSLLPIDSNGDGAIDRFLLRGKRGTRVVQQLIAL